VASFIQTAPIGCYVEVRKETRSDAQNRALHAALTDIANQVVWHGQTFNVVVWKRLCTAAWLREKGETPELIPAIDGKGFDIIYERTSQMNKTQLSELLEWVYAFGAQNGVTFKDRAA
jgi:hypothetical protein